MDDFERRRELRRQKRDEMRTEVERVTYQRNDDDEEEAARERRRRARQERQRLQGDGNEVNSQNSITVEETRTSITTTDLSADDEAALLERLAKREERRQKRLKEAMERQKEYDPTISVTTSESYSISKSTSNGEDKVQENDTTPKENDSEPIQDKHEEEEVEKEERSIEKNDRKEEEEEEQVETHVEVEEEVQEETPEEPVVEENQVKDEKPKGGKEELKASWERKKGFPESKVQNGEHEATPQKLKHLDKFGGSKGQPSADEADSGQKVEAGKKLEDLRRRRGDTETGEHEKLKQKQQESSAELEELKRRREERKKLQEEEEQRRKQGEAEKKAREEEEKKRMREEIERRRAEAAEKRQKLPDEGLSEDKKQFKSLTPKGSSFKIEERAEFLNRSTQKSVKSPQPTSVSKIDSRLEQYTSAIGNNKGTKPVKGAPSDLPLQTEGVRNIKSMWEKGNVFSSPGTVVSPNKETAGLKIGVSSRINEWLTKTPETNKTPSSKPADLRPGDVSGKRNLWERQPEKASTPAK